MKLTTKGRFAVTAMLDIALHDPEEYVSIDAIFQVPILSRSSESCAEPDSLKACAVLPAVTVWPSLQIRSR